MDVSENSGFSPQIIHFNRVFHYKPSILGIPLFSETLICNASLFQTSGSHCLNLHLRGASKKLLNILSINSPAARKAQKKTKTTPCSNLKSNINTSSYWISVIYLRSSQSLCVCGPNMYSFRFSSPTHLKSCFRHVSAR